MTQDELAELTEDFYQEAQYDVGRASLTLVYWMRAVNERLRELEEKAEE